MTDDAVKNLPETSLRKRQQIVDAALECFVDLGYQGTSMNAVAERAGVIKQTIYSHFADKEALFKQVIQSATVDFVQQALASPSMAKKSPRDRLLKIAQTMLSRHQDPQYGKFFRVIIGEAGRFPGLAQLFTETTVVPGIELVASMLRDKAEFDIEDPEAFARIFMGTVINYCTQQNILRGKEFAPFSQERLLTELMRLVDMHAVKQR